MQNPFDIPGMMGAGDSKEAPVNPLFASLDMMRSVWETMGMGGAGHVADTSAAFLSPEDLEKRLRDLRAVESWLKLNLSMLESTIQGLEIQRATISTVQDFAQRAAHMAQMASAAASGQEGPNDTPAGDGEASAESAQAWWDVMQRQFETMANATMASMQSAQSMAESLAPSVADVSGDSTFTKPAAKKAAKKASKKVAKKAATKASRTAGTSTKTAAKKSTRSTSQK